MTVTRDEAALRLAPSGEYASHTFKECGLCGWLRWSCSQGRDDAGPQPALVFEPFDTYDYERGSGCERCQAVYQRAPEIATWVAEAIGHLRRRMERSE